MHLELPLRTQPDVGLHPHPRLLLQPRQVLRRQLRLEQLELQGLFSLLQLLQHRKFCFQLLVALFLGADLTTLVALRRVDVANTQLRKEEALRVLDRLSPAVPCGSNTRIRDIQKALKLFGGAELIQIGQERARIQVLEGFFKDGLL